MILYLSQILIKNNIFFLYPLKYITIRMGMAIFTSFFMMLLIMPRGIKFLKSLQKNGQPIRNDGPESHATKKGTPTMGGVFIIFSIITSSTIWTDLFEIKVVLCLIGMILFCIIGFFDDFKKLSQNSPVGIRGKYKFITEILLSGALVYILYKLNPSPNNYYMQIPLIKNCYIYLGIFYILFASFVITGSSNAVNLTDGLDGLVSMPIFLTAFALGIISYLSGDIHYSQYLHISHIQGAGELSIICGAIMGSCLGFLWFNSKPADVFMGDTGSLSLGAGIGIIAVFIKHELMLPIIGFIFLIEALSVIIQVGYFKMTGGKRVFLMAPIHHHFEKKGLSETKVVSRFWIVSFIFTIIGLAMIKIK